jgi:intergrase/recombinase
MERSIRIEEVEIDDYAKTAKKEEEELVELMKVLMISKARLQQLNNISSNADNFSISNKTNRKGKLHSNKPSTIESNKSGGHKVFIPKKEAVKPEVTNIIEIGKNHFYLTLKELFYESLYR